MCEVKTVTKASELCKRVNALIRLVCLAGVCLQNGDAEHITAILGESVILNCAVSHPKIPYIIHWKRQVRCRYLAGHGVW